MFKVFVDPAAWVALLNTRDELHQTAQRQMQELQRQSASLITTDFVLLELEQIQAAFTSDHHFEQAGLTKLL